MALSTYWVSQNRKDLAEKALVAKRDREANRTQKCLEVDSYHKQLALTTSKYRNLEEGLLLKTPRENEESSVREKQRVAKKEKLEYRRQKLSHILALENEQYEKELEKIRDSEREKDPWNISILKQQISDLQKKRREAEESMQKRYSRDLFNSNIPVNMKTDETLQKEATEAWQQRKEELERLNKEREEREREKARNLEQEQLEAFRGSREVEMSLLEEQERWSTIVKGRVEELNTADEETKKLKVEKQILIGHLETLLSLQKKRDDVRNIQKQTIKKMQFMWQPKERLRRILVEVQHALDFDCKLLSTMKAFNGQADEDTALALLNTDCVDQMNEKLEMQMALEKQREVEILHLYNEEAGKVFASKLDQWSLESLARDELMEELFKTMAKEINAKIDSNIGREKSFIAMKENWLREIEEANDKSKGSVRSLRQRHIFYQDKAKLLEDELQSIKDSKTSRPPSSCDRAPIPFEQTQSAVELI